MMDSDVRIDQVYLAAGYTDLRLGIDGLAALVEYQYGMNPRSNTLFLFCGRRADRIKGLLWQPDGFLLLYKRLDDGRFRWPRSKNEFLELSRQQLRWLLEGLSIDMKSTVKRRDKSPEYTIDKV